MIVCIAEKPSVAQNIARLLKATTDCRDKNHNGYFEGNGYQVTWTYGHLCELKNPEEYTPQWKVWALSTLPMIPQRFQIHLKEEARGQFEHIKRLMQKADMIINCGDAGQEGELIQRWVMQQAQPTCPVKRLWVSSMTDEAYIEGFANLRPQDDYQSLYEAALCRSIGDWLLGMNATRLYTLKYGQNNRSAGRSQPLSIGRVQTPTLALIVKRYHEIKDFKPEPFWVLSTIYRDVTFTAKMADENPETEEGNEGKGNGNEGNANAQKATIKRGYTDREEAEAALRAIEDNPFTVTDIQKKNGTEAPPRLFDLTSLQVECNRKFGYGADLTLQLIQQLYEGKVATYPRVDTTFLPEDVYPKCGGILNGIKDVPCFGDPSARTYGDHLAPLRGKPLKKSKKVFDSSKITDHHAIIPTGVPPRGLTDLQRNVYDLIVRRFIAAFYPDCKYATTTIEGMVEQNTEKACVGDGSPVAFKATGKIITDPGWRVVIKGSSNSNDNEQQEMPPFTKGESGPHVPTLTERTTQPPKPYTEATLLRAMETAGKNVDDEELRDALKANGIGRPSTRAEIIKTLYRRGYMRQVKKSLEPTATGIELIAIIKEELLKSAELTGIWEKKLRQIERHEYNAAQFIAELKAMVCEIVNEVMRDPSNRRIMQGQTPDDTANRTSGKTENTGKRNTQTTGKASEDAPKRKIIRAGSTCPLCGEGKVIKGNTAYGCSRWREGCNWRKPFKG